MTQKLLGQHLIDVRDRLGEPREGYWRNQELRRWTNEALRRSARDTKVLTTTTTTVTVAGTQSYTLPTNAIEIYRAEWYPTGSSQRYPLRPMSVNAADQRWGINQAITQSTPEVYVTSGYPPTLTALLYPIPSVAGVLKSWYVKFPALLAIDGSDDDVVLDWPEGWEDMLADFVEYRAWLKKGDTARAGVAETNWRNNIERITDVGENWVDAAGEISFDPWWWVNGPEM
jgi:hypothetical protein